MADYRINADTGELAVQQNDGKWKIYPKGQYKFNTDTGQYAVPVGQKWQIIDRRVGPVKSDKQGYIDLALSQVAAGNPRPQLSKGDAAMTAKAEAAIRDARFPDQGMIDANLNAAAQGAGFNYLDEIFGGIAGAKAAIEGLPVKPEYYKARDFARGQLEADTARYPKSTMASGIAGNLMTAIPSALLTGGTSLPAVMGISAAQGAAGSYGATKENDVNALIETAVGAGLGAAGGGLGWAAGKILQKLTSRGLAAGAVLKAMDGNTDELVSEMRRLGASAAEVDDVLKTILREQAATNSGAAMRAVGPAQARLADVNAQAIDDINRLVSPENVAAFTQRTQDATRSITTPGYAAVADDPAQIALTQELDNMPGVDDAIEAARQLAAFEKRPFDPSALTVKDLDVMQRFLRLAKEKAFQGTALETLKGPAYGTARTEINELAKQASPALAQSQAAVALQKSVDEAAELGGKALNPSKEAVEVVAEFNALTSPEAQAGYRAALATKLRAMLASKSSTANVANVLDKPAIIEKLKAVGFPEQEIDAIISRGGSARGVLDALQGGSDTARKLAAAEAARSPLSNVSNKDLMTAALTHWGTLGILPLLRSAGRGQESRAAELVIKALTSQSPEALQGLLRYSPQALTPKLGLLGGAAANQIRPLR